MFWGEMIYATPGCGKTFVADKYRDVVDGDDLIVEAISELRPNFYQGNYDDPRTVILNFFRYINFNRRIMWEIYNCAIDKMEEACRIDDVVLFGTLDLMDRADRIFLQKETCYVRRGFQDKQWRETEEAQETQVYVHNIYEYLDKSLHRVCKNTKYIENF